MRIDNFTDYAVHLAKKSPMESRYAAILIHQNNIISYGFNSYSGKCHKLNKCCFLRALQAQCPR